MVTKAQRKSKVSLCVVYIIYENLSELCGNWYVSVHGLVTYSFQVTDEDAHESEENDSEVSTEPDDESWTSQRKLK